jgi:hypothetical protein
MSKPQIGQINYYDEEGKRDAFHVPCILATAIDHMMAGQVVKFVDDKVVACMREDSHGIIDPFIETNVIEPGQKFWVMLNPDLVTNLVHHFTVEGIDTEVVEEAEGMVTIDKAELERLQDVDSRFDSYDDDEGECRACY